MLCLFHLCHKVNLITLKCLESFRNNMKFEICTNSANILNFGPCHLYNLNYIMHNKYLSFFLSVPELSLEDGKVYFSLPDFI
uniref:Uncharacterized protein n=1 Tax=Octopus bimaculoides TaxID=37653 RepID=A0A0L8HFF7_OCTBM